MTTRLADITGDREVVFVEGHNKGLPNSVFVWGNGFSYEFDRFEFIDAMRTELGMSESFESALEHLLHVAA